MDSSRAGMDVVDVLTEDHRDVSALIANIKSVTDPVVRRDLTDTVISELVRHAVAEEMYVYPAMRDHLENGDKAVAHDVEEHDQIERVMKRLEDVDVRSAEFEAALVELERMVEHHVRDEEGEQFPLMRQEIPREELVELAEKVETAKKLAPTRPHPNAPNSELFHKLVGPGVGLVDRLRDKLSGRATR